MTTLVKPQAASHELKGNDMSVRSHARSSVEFFTDTSSLDQLSTDQFEDKYQAFFHLIIRLADQCPVAGIRIDDRDTLVEAFEKQIPKEDHDDYMVRFGPQVSLNH